MGGGLQGEWGNRQGFNPGVGGLPFCLNDARNSTKEFSGDAPDVRRELRDFAMQASYYEEMLHPSQRLVYVRYLVTSKVTGRAKDQIGRTFQCGTVAELVGALERVCVAKEGPFQLKLKLLTCRQNTRDMRSFVDELRDLGSRVLGEDPSPEARSDCDGMMLTALMSGADEQYAKPIMMATPQTFERAVELANMIDMFKKGTEEKEKMVHWEQEEEVDLAAAGTRFEKEAGRWERHPKVVTNSDRDGQQPRGRSRERNMGDRDRSRERSFQGREREQSRNRSRSFDRDRSRDRGRRNMSRERSRERSRDRNGRQRPRSQSFDRPSLLDRIEQLTKAMDKGFKSLKGRSKTKNGQTPSSSEGEE